MATNNRMALLEQLSKYVVEKDKDFLKEALTLLINALMDAEVTSIIGAEKYERNKIETTIAMDIVKGNGIPV